MEGAAPAATARTLTAAEVATLTGGTLVGDGSTVVTGVAPLATATPSQLSFCGESRYAERLAASQAGVVLVTASYVDTSPAAKARIVVKNPMQAMMPLLRHFHPDRPRQPGIHPTAIIGRGVRLGADVTIGPYVILEADVVIGDLAWIESHCVVMSGARLGDDVHLYPHVTVFGPTVLGDRVEIGSGSRIGAAGFGYRFDGTGHQRIPHVARAVIEHDVSLGSNCNVDRGTLEDTVIGAGSKLDGMVHVGHNVLIGKLCLIMAQTGIAGSSILEDGVVLAGQVGVSGHLTIGKGARLAAQTGAIGDLAAGGTYSGFPARPHREVLKGFATLFKLTEMLKDLERLVEKERG
ncbi:MAG: UDP-3-O-(3-hydroxymyristoyl)glucosamine N-acyltransferase [Gemmatimonadetes bacterium]|nr:UDP-3-O-(3-hydroxymyristoyl)glucosamine N-acyltransferase [Gemmatimonadota bacterium]